MNDISLALLILGGLLLLLALVLILCLRRLFRLQRELASFRQRLDCESQKRIGQSKAVILGQVAEHFAPFLPGFPWNPKDARFLGAPVDYIVFDGLNDQSASPPEIRNVIICEIKTANATLSASERAIRDAVAAGRVRFEVIRIPV